MEGARFNLHFLLVLVLLSAGACNQMDPHVFPGTGPFFEGWYTRIIDPNHNASFGLIVAQIKPARPLITDSLCTMLGQNPLAIECKKLLVNNDLQGSNVAPEGINRTNLNTTPEALPLVYATILSSLPNRPRLQSMGSFYSPKDYKVTKNGHTVTHNPDDRSPPNFEVQVGSKCSYVVTSTDTNFKCTVGSTTLRGKITAPVPWGPNGKGPENWLEHLPLPLHWFVYSLRSQVLHYEYENKETGHVVKGGSRPGQTPVVAHMEKNWGQSFPKAWIWAEGVDPTSNVSFAITAGLLTIASIDIKAQLSGYRNPQKGISCSFDPVNSGHTLTHDGCKGAMKLEVNGLECAVTFAVSAPPETFSSCLFGPGPLGFRKNCAESFVAVANITVHERKRGRMVLTDSQVIALSALEFGGRYMCHGKCPSIRSLAI